MLSPEAALSPASLSVSPSLSAFIFTHPNSSVYAHLPRVLHYVPETASHRKIRLRSKSSEHHPKMPISPKKGPKSPTSPTKMPSSPTKVSNSLCHLGQLSGMHLACSTQIITKALRSCTEYRMVFFCRSSPMLSRRRAFTNTLSVPPECSLPCRQKCLPFSTIPFPR